MEILRSERKRSGERKVSGPRAGLSVPMARSYYYMTNPGGSTYKGVGDTCRFGLFLTLIVNLPVCA